MNETFLLARFRLQNTAMLELIVTMGGLPCSSR